MLTQCKYSLRIRLNLRLVSLAATVLICALFSILTLAGMDRIGGMITGLVLTSLGLCALMVANVIADYESIRNVFAAPVGYPLALAPIPGWKILLGRLLPMVVWDLISYAIGIACVVIQSLTLAGVASGNFSAVMISSDLYYLPFSILMIVLQYTLLFLIIFFSCAVAKSLFFRVRARGFLGFLSACAVLYVLNFADLLIAPFASMERWGLTFFINVQIGTNLGTFVALSLLAAKIVLLFLATAHLIERKVNL